MILKRARANLRYLVWKRPYLENFINAKTSKSLDSAYVTHETGELEKEFPELNG